MTERWLIAVAAVVLVACGDGTAPGGDNPAALRLISGSGQSGTVGQPLPLPLVVEVRGFDTLPLPGVRVDFRATAGAANLSSASVETDVDGRASVLVSPAAAGAILVTASIFSSPHFVTFLLSSDGPASPPCAASDATLLAPGQVEAGLGGAGICLAGGASGATYALVAFNSVQTPGAVTGVQLTAAGITPSVQTSFVRGEGTLAPRPLHRFGATHSPRSLASASGLPPARVVPGELQQFNVNFADDCANPVYRVGRVAAITATAIVFADTANPPGELTDGEYEAVGIDFDTLWNPSDTLNFRAPADVDDNQRIVLFFTSAMNASVADHASHPSVHFLARDLRPVTATAPDVTGCASSNAAELLYVATADPNGVSGTPLPKEALLERIARATVHGYAHLINASIRLGADPPRNLEEPWLDEALGQIAEELLFQRVSARVSRANLNAFDLSVTLQSLNAFLDHQQQNVEYYETFLRNVSTTTPLFDVGSPAARGAGWSLLRYLVDRRGGADYVAWTQLVNTAATGFQNLTNVFGPNLPLQLRDWSVALLTDDLFFTAPEYQLASWNFRSIFAALEIAPYPLAMTPLAAGGPINASIGASGAAYFVFRVPAGSHGSVNWSGAAGAVVPPLVQWSVVRVD